MHLSSRAAMLIATAAFTACTNEEPSPNGAASGVVAAASAPADKAFAWQGRWAGPEGTSLEIRPTAAGYDVVVTNLDGPRTFAGQAGASTIRFERDGVTESIQAGSGKQTGMKWLDGKTDCLVVKAGEGYCRD